MSAWAAQSGASVRLEWGAAADVALCLDEDASGVAAGLVRDCFVAA